MSSAMGMSWPFRGFMWGAREPLDRGKTGPAEAVRRAIPEELWRDLGIEEGVSPDRIEGRLDRSSRRGGGLRLRLL